MNIEPRARGVMAPDWAAIITELLGAGVAPKDIGAAMGQQITDRMMQHYLDGTQPAYWRGELLIGFWCKHLGKTVDQIPRAEVIRGHSVARGQSARARYVMKSGEERLRLSTLQAIAEAIKPKQREPKKRGRKKKVEVVT